ncbi:apolipoprotein N-acyltransferase, partial [bacterium]|nr:apolipoprotein N-acyltransferase [bacterium]
HKVHLAAGSVDIEGRGANGRWIYYNTQFVFDPEGVIANRYNKIVLLAFGEYIPFLETFPFLEKWLPASIASFTRGTEKPVFTVEENLRWLPLICYEDIIAGFVRGFEHRKADFMVNTTNDGWFGRSPASHLHKQMARPRTVEYRKPIVRVLNTGSSQVIDAAGRIISKQTELYKQDFINVTLNLPRTPRVTLYARIGHWPIYLLIAGVSILWLRKKIF